MNFILDFLVEIYLAILKWLKVPLSLSYLLCESGFFWYMVWFAWGCRGMEGRTSSSYNH